MSKIELKRILIIVFAIILFLSGCGQLNEPDYCRQWYLNNTGNNRYIAESNDYQCLIPMTKGIDISWELMCDELPELTSQVTVAIIDDGVDYTHSELQNIMWINKEEVPTDGIDNDGNGYIDDVYGYNFLKDKGFGGNSDEETVKSNHGTLCAGIIAAEENACGICGVASCVDIRIMSIKVMENHEGVYIGDSANLVKAIAYAEEMGADICNLSLNYSEYDSEVEKAIQNSSMLFVVSAGNGAGKGIDIDCKASYPACYDADNMLVVVNMDYSGELSISSNYGKTSADIAAPGECIYTTFTNNRYIFASGTSMSAAVVSGVAAVLKAANNEADALSIKRAIVSSSVKSEGFSDKVSSGGYVNAAGALKIALGDE